MNTPPQKEHKNRLFYIDNLRVLACFLVILTHSTMPSNDPEKDGIWMGLISLIGSPSSELFLALSGTVLLPIKTGFGNFYKRRFTKLVPPLVIWSILGVLLFTQTRDLPWSEAGNLIIHIPVAPAIGVYWFVYAMAGLYLLAPYISPWLQKASKKELEFYILLWLVNMIIPWLENFSPNLIPGFIEKGNYYWMLCYFGGFLGYWLWGFYLNRYPIKINANRKFILIVLTSLIYPIVVTYMSLNGISQTYFASNLQLGSVAWVGLLYILFYHIRLPEKIQAKLTQIAKYSFGIYLTHIYLAKELYWGIFEGSTLHILPRTFIIALLTLITGYVLSWLLTKAPGGKYITGT